MPFCRNCGNKLPDDSKFCNKCGMATEIGAETRSNQRKTTYDGEIHKCPNCGAQINAFDLRCSDCGYELRGVNVSNSVQKLAEKLCEIELSRKTTKMDNDDDIISETDQKKITAISSFPIPNTKEDIFEFMVMASSNISDEKFSDDTTATQKALYEAWQAKFEQAYEKAKFSFDNNDSEFIKIKDIYVSKTNKLKKGKIKHSLSLPITIIATFTLILGVAGLIFAIDDKKIEKKENELNKTVQEIYEYVDEGQYDLARTKATTLVFSGSTTKAGEQEVKKWEKIQKEIIDVIEKAEQGE